MTTQNRLQKTALVYAAMGLPILPCKEKGKDPATLHGVYDATSDPLKIEIEWKRNPNFNVAIRTGVEVNGVVLVVLDIDPRNDGANTLATLVAKFGQLPTTATVITGRRDGGRHYYFRCPAWVKLKGKLGPGADVQSRGKYVIAPPSIHPDTEESYEWDEQHNLLDGVPIAELPQWLIDHLSIDTPTDLAPPSQFSPSSIYIDDDTKRDIRSALLSLHSEERDLWIQVGLALKDLGDVGRALWMEWSTTSEKFDARQAETTWRSLKPERIGYQTVFSLAQARGWLNPKRNVEVPVLTPVVDWPEPTPLPTLPPVQPFRDELMPITLRPWVADISQRMQCPPDFPAMAAIVAASSLISAYAVVQPKERDDWQVTPNLGGMGVGRSGVKKSPALNEALKPLKQLQLMESKRWQAECTAWESECNLAAQAKLDPPDPSTKPVERRFIVNDATVEKLGEILQQNPGGTLVFRDELYGLLTSLDKQGQEGSRTFYLTGFDGNQDYTFDRIGRGTVRIPRVCISMIGGIQPGRVQEYVRGAVNGGSADDGLLQRFGLAVWPDIGSKYEYVDQYPDVPARQAAEDVFRRLAQQLPTGCDYAPKIWRFTPEAQAMYVEWSVQFETEIRADDMHQAIASHLAKYRKVIPALALVFALIDTPDSGGVIGQSELKRALLWCAYLRSHAVRLYSAATTPETTAAAALLKRIKTGVLGTVFTPRQVAQKGWMGLNSPELAQKAANVLADFDWLRLDKQVSNDPKGRGRPSERYFVNPAALPGCAAA